MSVRQAKVPILDVIEALAEVVDDNPALCLDSPADRQRLKRAIARKMETLAATKGDQS